MGKINVLDFQVANLIAAGEVVERPASAVKELLENAVDAGSTEVTVEIKRGGTTFIRVSDNGCGMSAEDLPVSIRRHATSKIKEARDLDGIATLGFRGEALAAISSVSSMRIMTKRKEDTLGSLLCAREGQIVELSEVGCKNGTTVIVEELFANVPARRKFLKKDQYEAMAVTAMVEKIALSRPDIAIKLILDGAMKFQTPGDGKILSAVYAVWGREFAGKLLEVDSMTEGIEVCGYIGRPDNVRSNRNYQNFFLNGRYVRSKTATAAVEQAFESYIETEKFPCCVLYIYIHPTFVDVNVHPTKLEVKFSNERVVFEGIFCAVRNALMTATDRPQVLFEPSQMTAEQHNVYNAFVPVYDRIADTKGKTLSQQQLFDQEFLSQDPQSQRVEPNQSNQTVDAQPYIHLVENPPVEKKVDSISDQKKGEGLNLYSLYSDLESAEKEISDEKISPPIALERCCQDELDPSLNDKMGQEESGSESDFLPVDSSLSLDEKKKDYRFSLGSITPSVSPSTGYKLLGTAFQTYILAEFEDHLLIVDKHAAHERILFEQMKSIMQAQKGNVQTLLVPFEISLTPPEEEVAASYGDSIRKVGFEFQVKDGKMIVSGIPSLLSSERAQAMLETLVGQLSDGTGSVESTRDSFFEKALYQGSCKAAVKGGQVDSQESMQWIVDTLLQNPTIICCPHGRPVAIEMTKQEMERLFKRI
jgi:DNA mismatch repair protein MutL